MELTHAVVFQTASILLDYPESDDGLGRLVASAVDELRPGEARDSLRRFLIWWEGLSWRDREMEYVRTFDLCSGPSLYLTAEKARDKRCRGEELLRFQDLYRGSGFSIGSEELPDYLPTVLEFAACAPEGGEALCERVEALAGLKRRLEEMSSPFSDVVGAVVGVLEDRRTERSGER